MNRYRIFILIDHSIRYIIREERTYSWANEGEVDEKPTLRRDHYREERGDRYVSIGDNQMMRDFPLSLFVVSNCENVVDSRTLRGIHRARLPVKNWKQRN